MALVTYWAQTSRTESNQICKKINSIDTYISMLSIGTLDPWPDRFHVGITSVNCGFLLTKTVLHLKEDFNEIRVTFQDECLLILHFCAVIL